MNGKAKAMNRGKSLRLLAVAILAIVVVATGAYFLVHHIFSSKAADDTTTSKISRGVVNELSDFNKKISDSDGDGIYTADSDYAKTLGTPENPFLVLEITPNSNYAFFGYMIDGCQPFDMGETFLKCGSNAGGVGTSNGGFSIGSFPNIQTQYAQVSKVFIDEHIYEEKNYGAEGFTSDQCNQQYYTKDWRKKATDELSCAGYYEYVGTGKGTFKYAGEKLTTNDKVGYIQDYCLDAMAETKMKEKYSTDNALKVAFFDLFCSEHEAELVAEKGGSIADIRSNMGTDWYRYGLSCYTKYFQEKSGLSNWNFYYNSDGQTEMSVIRNVMIESFKDEVKKDFADKVAALQADIDSATTDDAKTKAETALNNYLNSFYNFDNIAMNHEDTTVYSGKYAPNFVNVGYGNGSWIWVSLETDTTSLNSATITNIKKTGNYNRRADSATDKISFTLGDREYTTRTDTGYYVTVNNSKLICLNDFFTNCLNMYKKGKDAVENYSIVYKVAEPWELVEHPEWIDRADLMYLHQADETGMNGSGKFFDSILSYNNRFGLSGSDALTAFHDNDPVASTIRVNTGKSKTQLGDDFGKLKADSSKQNDISFDCALRMFKKVNGFDMYKKNRAPIIYPASLFQGTGNYFTKNVSANYLEYTTLDENTQGIKYSNSGVNNNVYKFLLMQNLMDPINFNSYFVEGKRSSNGEKVIQDINGTGSCTSHSGDAATYWCPQTFLPCDYKQSGSYITATDVFGNKVNYIDKYKIYAQNGNSFLNPKSNQAIHGYGCVYNGNNVITTLFGTSYVNSNSGLDGYDELEDYFNDEESDTNLDDTSSFTWADIIHFLLQYNRGGDTDDDDLDGDIALKVLEIEPSNDFILSENVLKAYLPSTDYDGEYEMYYMTTNELNGNLDDITTNYDMVFIGNQTRKFNLIGDDPTDLVNYNSSDLSGGFSYTHVGDEYVISSGTARTSGNDLTTSKYNSLLKFFKSKRILVLDKNLKNGINKFTDSSSNMRSYLKYVTDSSSNGNVNTAYGMVDFYDDDVIDHIKELCKSKISYTKDPDGKVLTTSDTEVEFAYTINKSGSGTYGVRLYLDSSHNGIIDEDSKGSREDELLYDSASSDRNDVAGVTIKGATGGKYNATDKGSLVLDLNSLSSEMKEALAVGNLTYMIEIYNTSNENDSSILRGSVSISAEVYKALTKKSEGATGEEYDSDLKILQIVPDDKIDNPSANLELALKDTGSDFYTYTKKTGSKFYDYYDGITIETISISDYVAKFDGLSESSANVTKYTAVDSTVNYFYPSEAGTANDLTIADGRTYNMLVVTDASELLDDASYNDFGAVSYIAYVATAGSRIVFTGDALNSGDAGSDNFEVYKRVLGLNRYDSKATGYDSKFKIDGADISADVKDYTYVRALEDGSADDNSYKPFQNKKWVSVSGGRLNFGTGGQSASNISRNNKGAVTQTPYEIDENIGIYGTVAKDYTLNLYNPNVNVWYSLAGDYYDDKAIDKDFHDLTDYSADDNWKLSTYGISPNDAANNYYVYTLANVSYCGIDLAGGNAKAARKATKYANNTPQETQLFINTLVSAQNQSTPSVIITDVTDINPNNEDKEKTVFDEITVTDADSAGYEMASLGTNKTLVDKFFYSLGLAGQRDEKTSYNYKEYYKGETGEVAEGDGGTDTTIIPPEGYDENKDNSDPDNENVDSDAAVTNVTEIFTHAYTYDLLYYGPDSFAEKVREREGVDTDASGIATADLEKISANPQSDADGNTIYNTNKIFFSPIEKLKLYGKIKKFNAYLCTTSDNKEIGTSKKITSIYEKRGKNYYRLDASSNGFTTEDGNYLMNRNSYFVLYNKYDANYNTVKFVIETDNHVSVAYLYLEPQEEEETATSEDVYLFDLD
ncbi:MAG: DUF5057 domain-containing protein [Lachnospiraceae bacterium]|nr:DUF5057 domain-containing protein [Lachnospiraceae bacterium]